MNMSRSAEVQIVIALKLTELATPLLSSDHLFLI
ncbi:Uncharacterised protein [Atlantibacter hermannii]|nr:Uncharacterised protein [Atlantibacter hermannii]